MKPNIIYSLALALLAGCAEQIVIPNPGTEEAIDYSSHFKNAQYLSAITQYRKETNSPGVLLLVDRPGEPVWAGAVGQSNLEYQSTLKNADRFRTGSVTKMFTAVVILKLVEENKLKLEDKLADVLPQVKGKIPSSDVISVRHLLAHLSGITDPPNESLRYKADIINRPSAMYALSVEEALEKYVYDKDLHFTPGTAYSYSNTNYWLLGMMAEKLSGKKIQELMDELIFTPLGMKDSYIEKRNDAGVVRGYADIYNNGTLMDVSHWDRAEGDGEADGGLISTAGDLHRFMRALFGGHLISNELLAEMKRVQLASCNSPDCEYGLGLELWRTSAGIAYGHNGGLVGIEANALYFESSGGIYVVFKNNGNGSRKNVLEDLMK